MKARKVRVNAGGIQVQNTVTLDGKRVVELFMGDFDGASLTPAWARRIADALNRAAAYIEDRKPRNAQEAKPE